MAEAARGRASTGLRSLITVDNLQEFIRPTRPDIANHHIILVFFLFFLISMADVLTTAKFLSLG